MASFASSRRSGWVRVLVLILCALFIFATIGAPPAHALGVESVAVFGLASVLSAATAALGFKLASNEQGQATLQKMVQDFKTVAWATGFVLVGSKLNGLQHGMDYIKMQVKEGKTYLDSRVFAWVQKWLAEHSTVYSSAELTTSFRFDGSSYFTLDKAYLVPISQTDFYKYFSYPNAPTIYDDSFVYYGTNYNQGWDTGYLMFYSHMPKTCNFYYQSEFDNIQFGSSTDPTAYIEGHISKDAVFSASDATANGWETNWKPNHLYININRSYAGTPAFSNYGSISGAANNSGLSGTDTLGKDVIDLTLDQILEKLKEWAQDWFDAGADSATNAATGAQDLPLTVATGAATANPSIAEDGPLVWFPSFGLPIPKLRTGETDTKTVDQGKENASAAETSTVDVAENQSVINSLVNWALNYISPDTGLFSKFPLCVPYDAYLLVTSSLGVDAIGSDSIFGASPGDLEGVVSQDIDTYSDFQPIINIKHDFELDGKTYPVELTIDLTPWQPFVTFFREGMALLLIAELIGSEFKRIRGH